MTIGPFPADAAAARRVGDLRTAVGAPVEGALAAILDERRPDPRTAATIPASAVARLVAQHDLRSPREVALLALPLAAAMARPPISSYRVGVVGIEAGGDLVLGANLEFPGTDLTTTIHAEAFASLRARARGSTLRVLALTEAHPCAHCRQTLAESAGASDLELIDTLGHVLRLDDLYPWPFTPRALGIEGDDPSRPAWPRLQVASVEQPDVGDAVRQAARHAHAPYSRCPSAVALRLLDGRLLAAGCVESVSFNPTITAMQAALVELAAVGADGTAIQRAWLARVPGGSVDPAPGARALLRSVAPSIELDVVAVMTGAAEG